MVLSVARGVQRDIAGDVFKAHFAEFGDIEDCAVVTDANGVSRGFGFVTFSRECCTEKALIVRHALLGKEVDCKRAVPREEELRGGGGPAPRAMQRQDGGYAPPGGGGAPGVAAPHAMQGQDGGYWPSGGGGGRVHGAYGGHGGYGDSAVGGFGGPTGSYGATMPQGHGGYQGASAAYGGPVANGYAAPSGGYGGAASAYSGAAAPGYAATPDGYPAGATAGVYGSAAAQPSGYGGGATPNATYGSIAAPQGGYNGAPPGYGAAPLPQSGHQAAAQVPYGAAPLYGAAPAGYGVAVASTPQGGPGGAAPPGTAAPPGYGQAQPAGYGGASEQSGYGAAAQAMGYGAPPQQAGTAHGDAAPTYGGAHMTAELAASSGAMAMQQQVRFVHLRCPVFHMLALAVFRRVCGALQALQISGRPRRQGGDACRHHRPRRHCRLQVRTVQPCLCRRPTPHLRRAFPWRLFDKAAPRPLCATQAINSCPLCNQGGGRRVVYVPNSDRASD